MSTQCSDTGGSPLWYKTAVAETTAAARAPCPYQYRMVTGS